MSAIVMMNARPSGAEEKTQSGTWKIGAPIVTYFAGPGMSEAAVKQISEGGFTMVWCGEKDLDLLQAHGLRGMLYNGLLAPGTLENAEQRRQLDALIERVRKHPALYSYYIVDEPNASQFPALGKLVAYLKERDPGRMAYINLFPTYASNEQLGTKGDVTTAYREYLRQYVSIVKPDLLSYDHYQFMLKNDTAQYFLNLAMIRDAALEAGIPFLNIVQAASWEPGVRVPNADEMRYLVYTTAGYGAQGISYYVYTAANHRGGIALADGTPTPVYAPLAILNREFAALASQLQPLRSLGVYHTTIREAGCVPLPAHSAFQLNTPPAAQSGRGMMLSCFGKSSTPTHVLVVNLDYKTQADATLTGPGTIEVFDPANRAWTSKRASRVDLHLPPGGGMLVRLAR